MKKSIVRVTASNVQELITVLQDMVDTARLVSEADVRPTADTIYATINSDAIRLTLLEETLTDGSKVYNVELTEAVHPCL